MSDDSPERTGETEGNPASPSVPSEGTPSDPAAAGTETPSRPARPRIFGKWAFWIVVFPFVFYLIGTMVAFLDVVSVIEEAVYLGRPFETTELHIIKSDGRLIFSDGAFHVFENVSEEGYFDRISGPSGYFLFDEGGKEKLFSFSRTISLR